MEQSNPHTTPGAPYNGEPAETAPAAPPAAPVAPPVEPEAAPVEPERSYEDVQRLAMRLTVEQMIRVRQRLGLESTQAVIQDLHGVTYAAAVHLRITQFGVSARAVTEELSKVTFEDLCSELRFSPFEDDPKS